MKMKKLFLTLTIFLLSISFYPVKAMEKTADILKKNVVISGDGLYKDTTIEGRYIYRGGKPNNYIKLGDDIYRIISLEKDGTIKVIRQESIGDMKFDAGGARLSENSNDFCSRDQYGNYFGCNLWGSKTTILDSNGNKVTQMPWDVNGTLKNLPDKEASLNTYLNNDFYNGLSDDIKDFIIEKTWNVGPTSDDQTNLSESIKEESAYKWKGKVALMSVTDYVKASINSECSSVRDYQYISAGGKKSCYDNSNIHNYLYSNNYPWTVSFGSDSNSGYVSGIWTGGELSGFIASNTYDVLPVFYLSSNTTLNGEGTETNPYTVSKYVEEPKDEENNKDEVKVDNGQIVEVPSTSAFGSIIIAGLGIACVTGSTLVMRRTTRKK